MCPAEKHKSRSSDTAPSDNPVVFSALEQSGQEASHWYLSENVIWVKMSFNTHLLQRTKKYLCYNQFQGNQNTMLQVFTDDSYLLPKITALL